MDDDEADRHRAWRRRDGVTENAVVAERLTYVRLRGGGADRTVRVRVAVRLWSERDEVDRDRARALGRAADAVLRSLSVNEDSTELY